MLDSINNDEWGVMWVLVDEIMGFVRLFVGISCKIVEVNPEICE